MFGCLPPAELCKGQTCVLVSKFLFFPRVKFYISNGKRWSRINPNEPQFLWKKEGNVLGVKSILKFV